MGGPFRPWGGAVPDGPRPGGDERRDLPARRGLRYHGDHDPDRDRLLRPGDGRPDADRRQARRHFRAPAHVRDRPLHLRGRLGPDRRLLERALADVRLVGPRGDRRGACDAGNGRPRRLQFRGPGPGPRLRGPRGYRRGRHRGRPDPRRLGDDRVELAGRLRRRGGRRDRDPARHAADPRAGALRPETAAGLGRRGAFRRRPRGDGARRPAGEQLGVAAAAELADRALRPLADALRDRGGRPDPRRFQRLGEAARGGAARIRWYIWRCSRSRACGAAWRCCSPRTSS